jgi:hypothetical protein
MPPRIVPSTWLQPLSQNAPSADYLTTAPCHQHPRSRQSPVLMATSWQLLEPVRPYQRHVSIESHRPLPHPWANPNRHLMSTDALQIQQVLRVVAIRLMARHCSSAPSLGRSCGGRRGDPRAAIPRILIRARANTCASQALKILMRGVIVSRARSSAESSKVPLAAIFPGCVGRR